MVKLKIRKGDKVIVVTGKDKGKSGEVLNVIPKTNRVLLRGINVAKRHTAQSQTSQGGILDKLRTQSEKDSMDLDAVNKAQLTVQEGMAANTALIQTLLTEERTKIFLSQIL